MPQRILLKPDPLGVPRNPLAVFLLLLALVSGVPMMLGVTTANSVESALPHYVARLWGFLLVFGSLHTLVGMYWQGRETTGLLAKRIGMFTLTVASAIYAIILALTFGVGGTASVSVVAGFGVACAVQYKRLNDRVKAIIEATLERRASDGRDAP